MLKNKIEVKSKQIHFSPLIKAIVVIPVFKEPHILETLESLNQSINENHYGVLLVVNYGKNVSNTIKVFNQKTVKELLSWQEKKYNNLEMIILTAFDLEDKVWGVGLSRKIGLDFAAAESKSLKKNLPLIWLDADCIVSKNYLTYISKTFQTDKFDLGHLYFEHDLKKLDGNELNLDLKKGIIFYELFLRYYYQSLKETGYPFACHTVGSCLVCSSYFYQNQGGMNIKKAGEDFYFINKNIIQARFINLTKATVYPSSRTSDRVPFGTGKAQSQWLNKQDKFGQTYNPHIFNKLNKLFKNLETIYQERDKNKNTFKAHLKTIHEGVYDFFEQKNYVDIFLRIRKESKDYQQFEKKFFGWFNTFKILKFVHFMHGKYYEPLSLKEAVLILFEKKKINSQSSKPIDLLERLRKIDRL